MEIFYISFEGEILAELDSSHRTQHVFLYKFKQPFHAPVVKLLGSSRVAFVDAMVPRIQNVRTTQSGKTFAALTLGTPATFSPLHSNFLALLGLWTHFDLCSLSKRLVQIQLVQPSSRIVPCFEYAMIASWLTIDTSRPIRDSPWKVNDTVVSVSCTHFKVHRCNTAQVSWIFRKIVSELLNYQKIFFKAVYHNLLTIKHTYLHYLFRIPWPPVDSWNHRRLRRLTSFRSKA